jgi:gas vesicle protein
MTSESNVKGFEWCLGAFVLGAAAGVTVALLTAPRTGRDTREQLMRVARGMQEKAEQVSSAVQSTTTKAVNAGRTAFEQVQEEAS